MSAAEPGTIDWLVQELDADSGHRAEDAQAELVRRGRDTDVVAPLLRALPTLSRFGQLCAIEIVEELGDRRADQPLITLLDSEHDTVREWAAGVLGRWRVHGAIPAIRRAYQASLARRDPPDWSEPVVLRRALTDLGARRPVVPWLTASLQGSFADAWPMWPSTRLIDVIDELANHSQVTLDFELWQLEPNGSAHRADNPDSITTLDFTQPWPDLVVHARNGAVAAARRAKLGEHIVATIEWVDDSDLAIPPDITAADITAADTESG